MILIFYLTTKITASGTNSSQLIKSEEYSTEVNLRRDNRSHTDNSSSSNPSMKTNLNLSLDPREKENWNAKSKSMSESKEVSYKERKFKEKIQYKGGKITYSWKAETKSWIIGDTSRSDYVANAIYNGDSHKCPDEIVFNGMFNPNVNSEEVKEGPVEEVGKNAFADCGNNSNTTKVFVPKEVKIIREGGFCNMNKVTNFTIEIGSQLESIEFSGLAHIGYNEDRTDSDSFSPHQKNLILPHTLKSVSRNGIYYCNRFTRIIYCGYHNLSQNFSQLEYNTNDITKVYITSDYTANNGISSIFGRESSGVLTQEEINFSCSGMLPQQTPHPSQPPSPSPSPSPHFNCRCSPLQPQRSSPSLFPFFSSFPQ